MLLLMATTYPPTGGGITFPLGEDITFDADSTHDIGTTTVRPDEIFTDNLIAESIGLSAAGGSATVFLERDGNNILAQRNGTSTQAFNLYNTFTDASNYERMTMQVTSADFEILTEQAGTGSSRDIRIGTTGGTNLKFVTNNVVKWTILAGGNLFANTDNSFDIGNSSSTLRPRNINAGTSVNVGNGAVILTSGIIFVNDTVNGNMTIGVTINQLTSDNQAFDIKSSDVATGLTTGTIILDVETDDYYAISKLGSTTGGVIIQTLAEIGRANYHLNIAYGGAPSTTNTTSSIGAYEFLAAEHDGSNGLNDMAANSNLFSVGEITSAGARATRLLLKADDGQLFLGNTTLVALDHHDDFQLIRAFDYHRSGGQGIIPTEYDKISYNVKELQKLGVVGSDGGLYSVQGLQALQNGAIYRNHVDTMRLQEIVARQEIMLQKLQWRLDDYKKLIPINYH